VRATPASWATSCMLYGSSGGAISFRILMSSEERGLDDRLRWFRLLLLFGSALGGFSASLVTSGLTSASPYFAASSTSTFFSGLIFKFTSSIYTSGSLSFSETLAG